MKLPDQYTMRARWAPAVIAGAPAFAFAFALMVDGSLSATKAIASAGLFVLFIAFSDVARRRGRAIEPSIMEASGGNPSTTMLRYSSNAFDQDSLSRMHKFLASQLNTKEPTQQDEKADAQAADVFYARGATWLRENTRSKTKFNLILEENMTYGFRRNIYGMKGPALTLNFSIFFLCVFLAYNTAPLNLQGTFHQGLLIVLIVSIIHAAYFVTIVTKEAAVDASKIYARQLLLATESPHLKKVDETKRRQGAA